MSGEDQTETAIEETATERPSLWYRVKVRALKTVVLGLLGLVALVVAIIFGIDTGPGHRFVANQIAGLSFENGMRIAVGRIEGSLYGKMTLHDLSVRDPKGEFLFSPEIHVDWRPFAYLRDHVDVRSATAARMVLRRAPKFRETPPSDAPLLPDLDIDVGTLRIDRFIAEPPVSGERRIVSIDGSAHIADGRAQVNARGSTIAIAGKEGGDTFTLMLDAVPSKNRLGIDLDMDAPRGGLIASLAGLDQPMTLKIAGKGDWAAWNGTFRADLGKNELARLALTARNGTFAIKGPTHLARLFTGPTAGLLGPITNFDLSAALDERRATLSGMMSSDAFDFTPNGIVDLSENRFEQLKLAFVLLKPSAMAPNLSGAGLRALLTLDGAFTSPAVDYQIDAKRLVMNGVGLENLKAQGAARVDGNHVMIPVSARVQRVTGLDTAAGGTLPNVTLNGDIAIEGTRLLSDNMRLRSDRIDAGLILVADMSKGLYTGTIDGRVDNYRLASVGIFTVSTNMDLKTEARGFALQGTVKASSKKLLNDSLQGYLGGNFAASTNLRYTSDGLVRFTDLRLTAPDLRVTNGQGSWSPNGRIAFTADGSSDRYGAIGVRVSGTVADPDAHLTAEHPGLGIGLANLDARVTGAEGGYRLGLTGDTDYGPLKADVTLGTRTPTSLHVNSANLSGINFAGDLVQTSQGPFAGELTALGNGVGGVLRLDAEGEYQAADFNLRANKTVFEGPAQLVIGSARIDGRVVLYDQPTLVADAELSDTYLGSFNLAAGRMLIDYRDGRGKAKGLIEGISGVPFRLGFNADMTPELWRVALQGRVRGQTVKTVSPARIVPGAEGYELRPTTVSLAGGTVRLAGTYGPGLKLQSRLEGVDLALIDAFSPGLGFGGKANGSFDFEQSDPGAFPRADARLTLDGFTRTSATTISKPVDVSLVGKLLPDGGEAHAVIRQRGSVIGRLVANLKPVPPGDAPWLARLFEAPLSGGVRYNGPADTLFSFAGLAGQALTGSVGMAADFSCHLSDPCLNGLVQGKDMTYENLAYGTRLTKMTMSGKFSGDSLELTTLTAKAGDGSVSAKGKMSLAAESGYPMDISVELDKARLARSNALAATASGTLRLTKAAGETALLSGDLRLPETRYQIVREGAAQVPRLAGVRFKPPLGPVRITGDETAPSMSRIFSRIRLDLHLKAPDRLYVSGMGLESEWSADFDLDGTSAAPRLTGEVKLVRGTLGFAGRSFTIENGLISFTGGPAIDPTVAITATDTVEDVDVSVNVSGRAMDPQIDFSSAPSLPDDEILSRILFGSSVANLSALQAVQLASSLNSLRASGGGLNPLGKLTSATGIDRLRILGADEKTGRGTAVAAGQYLTDDIYVELITDARGFTATQLEVSVTKWLSVLSQAGGSGANKVNLRIKKDY
ncbi:translocation/assembly module TamB domain-containing protein [Novosphingobium mangrovi (ex Huang et al. 2023)]|uniref:Translocation/assembly module TamB domain-containing protein n=1 Tax=Novosphingobium mangrovi (ex Huang et al. 2023) TaxID=2976432 RepID=A0ABT2I8G0_9SPHN|nr:translocation/assembly module TamB domain-containing protein [Novosphingobium mangrovi (ex Huang et al. 2023)]MCT2401074.1 translocation/assembly module TamB domain-containing protein [Novosphingobium mangrovi (ex Huang et al. 2023)]